MANIQDCNFNSVWDGESVVITSTAKLDLDSGRVFDVERVEGEDDDGLVVETLDGEYIEFDGIDGEFEVDEDENGSYRVRDLARVADAIRNSAAARQPGL